MKDCAVKEKRSLIYNIESDVFKTFIIIVHISQKVSTNFHDNFQNIPRGLFLASAYRDTIMDGHMPSTLQLKLGQFEG